MLPQQKAVCDKLDASNIRWIIKPLPVYWILYTAPSLKLAFDVGSSNPTRGFAGLYPSGMVTGTHASGAGEGCVLLTLFLVASSAPQ